MNLSKKIRSGSTLAELVVGAVLATAMISLMSTLVIRTSRAWQETRRVQMAMDELSNQLEVLTLKNEQELLVAFDDLKVSEATKTSLPSTILRGKLLDDENGKRIELSLEWDRGVPSKAIAMVGWLAGSSESEVDQ